jgi:hypothetical protein
MIMKARAKRVHQGTDGSVHFLASSDTYSLLIITDPALGEDRIEFDGPCYLKSPSPMLPADYDGVEYQSISRTGSTRVTFIRVSRRIPIRWSGFVGRACSVSMTGWFGRCVLVRLHPNPHRSPLNRLARARVLSLMRNQSALHECVGWAVSLC